MASLRKKYQGVEVPSADNSAPAVSAAPVEAAMPPPAAETKAPEPPTEKQSPADEAGKDALRQRLAEMNRAEGLQLEFQQGQHRLAAEPRQQQQAPTPEQIIAGANIPDCAKHWLRQHPEFITDPAKNNTLVALHDVAKRMSGEEFTDNYFIHMEHLLGFRQQQQRQAQSNGAGNGHAPTAPARNGAAPPRQQQRSAGGPAFSAPPSRDAPSMATGRAQNHRAPLSEAEAEIARNSGLSVEEYQREKEKMLRLKSAGAIQ